MIKPTVILVWPSHIDYPLARYNLHRYKDYFNQVYIAFSHAYREQDYRDSIKSDLSFCTFIEVKREGGDWRNNAINSILEATLHNKNITHYLFLEQDFLVKDTLFWDKVLDTDNRFVYYDEQDRIHPSFAIVEKDLAHCTSLDFSAYPDEDQTDHFGRFFREVIWEMDGDDFIEIQDLGAKLGQDFYHLAGLTQNYACYKEKQPFFKPKEFLAYNYWTNRLDVDKPEDFDKMCRQIETEFGKGESQGFIKQFFPI